MIISLPAGVTCIEKHTDDCSALVYRDEVLGELGMIVVRDDQERCQIFYALAGDPNDPMTAKRKEIFEPLCLNISNTMLLAFGQGDQEHPLNPSPRQQMFDNTYYKEIQDNRETIDTQQIKCLYCQSAVALVIFGDGARKTGDFEDCARKLFADYRELNVPTWVIAAANRRKDNARWKVLKVWPQREPIQTLTFKIFNDTLSQLQKNHHCG